MSLFQYQMQMISTHTLTWSVTYRFSTLALYHANFNSHAHVERDVESAETIILQCISTHTLTWSVTPNLFTKYENISDFNSHAHVERDTMLLIF